MRRDFITTLRPIRVEASVPVANPFRRVPLVQVLEVGLAFTFRSRNFFSGPEEEGEAQPPTAIERAVVEDIFRDLVRAAEVANDRACRAEALFFNKSRLSMLDVAKLVKCSVVEK